MGFQVKPDVRNSHTPVGFWGVFAQQQHTPTREGENTPNFSMQPTALVWAGAPRVLRLLRHTLGLPRVTFPMEFSTAQADLRAQTAVLVTGDSKHQEAASHPTSKAHGQVSSHSP